MAAFVKLCAVFEELSAGADVLEFELLPKALQGSDDEILRDGRCIGIPKPLLVQAFVIARGVVFDHDSQFDIGSNDVATAIMLLLNPEHLTAANARKRHFQHIRQLNDREVFERGLQSEFRLLDSFCTSPLKKHTKSPTLWSHRRWLMNTYWSQPHRAHYESDVSSSFLKRGMDIVMKAGDRHPQNYYAWDYARKLLKLATRYGNLADQVRDPRAVVMDVHAWCTRHPSDISGWMFLLFLFRVMAIPGTPKVLIERTMEVAANLKLRGEAVWTFLRGATRHDLGLWDGDVHTLCTRMRDVAQTLQMSIARDQP